MIESYKTQLEEDIYDPEYSHVIFKVIAKDKNIKIAHMECIVNQLREEKFHEKFTGFSRISDAADKEINEAYDDCQVIHYLKITGFIIGGLVLLVLVIGGLAFCIKKCCC